MTTAALRKCDGRVAHFAAHCDKYFGVIRSKGFRISKKKVNGLLMLQPFGRGRGLFIPPNPSFCFYFEIFKRSPRFKNPPFSSIVLRDTLSLSPNRLTLTATETEGAVRDSRHLRGHCVLSTSVRYGRDRHLLLCVPGVRACVCVRVYALFVAWSIVRRHSLCKGEDATVPGRNVDRHPSARARSVKESCKRLAQLIGAKSVSVFVVCEWNTTSVLHRITTTTAA